MSEVSAVGDLDIVCVRADNPGPLTLSGTNTWVVGRDPAWVVDPGPADPGHLATVAAEVAGRGGAGGIALTHAHADHAEGLDPLAQRLGAAVPVLRHPQERGGPFEALPVPGHADDHVVFLWGPAAFTGDAVLGEGSVFVAGDMAAYLDGLRRLRSFELELLCPGHGPVVRDPAAYIDGYIAHRLDRERRLVEALHAGVRGDGALLDAAWPDAPPGLRPAAALTMHAHLRKLAQEGRLPPDMTPPPRATGLPAV
jgi:glyoxylase-like metal-dependent hydrolase (beta-lactamase superfamily II)